MRLKSSAGRISVHGNLEDDKILYRGLLLFSFEHCDHLLSYFTIL